MLMHREAWNITKTNDSLKLVNISCHSGSILIDKTELKNAVISQSTIRIRA